MLKKILVGLLLSFVLACGNQTIDEEHTISKINASTAEIVDSDGDTSCTAVWISSTIMLTAAHCVTGKLMDRMSIGIVGYRNYRQSLARGLIDIGYVIRLDTHNDLAIIKGDDKDHSWIEMNNTFHLGERLWIVGHTSGYIYSVAEGRISGYKELYNPSEFSVKAIQVSGPVWLGNSGGGIFNTRGQLLGICSFVSGKGPMISFYIPIKTAMPLLEGL